MIDRFISHIQPLVQTLVEGSILAALTGYQLASVGYLAFTDQDWTRLLGQQGLTVALLIAVSILWTSSVLKERKVQEREDRKEAKAEARQAHVDHMFEESNNRQLDILEKTNETSHKTAAVLAQCTNEVESLSTSVNRLVVMLEVSPCIATQKNRQAQ